ncbi:MAG: carbon-nitrogen hydrolase family protein [Chitinophagaceae bacterium]|nr:carbon-nitrogen hydrolase family protein [Chitinophagaceae bacterium]
MHSAAPFTWLRTFGCFICLFFSSAAYLNAQGGRWVKIATIGTAPSVAETKEPQKLVDQVIAFWKGRLDQALPSKPDLIVLPEACDRPGRLTIPELDYYKSRGDRVQEYFATVARENNCYIAFGSKRQEKNGDWRNSLILLDRQGRVAGIYDKNFPTIGEMEAGIKPGFETPVFKCDFGTVAGAICFDLNFEEVLQPYVKAKPDIILFSSMYHGGLAQSNWAYACRSYFVGSISDRGTPSEIRNPLGEVIARTTNYFDFTVASVNLDYAVAHLDYNWERLRALKKKYGETVNVHDPGQVGAALITSQNNNVNIAQMVKEFKIELLDDYFERARKFRLQHK